MKTKLFFSYLAAILVFSGSALCLSGYLPIGTPMCLGGVGLIWILELWS